MWKVSTSRASHGLSMTPRTARKEARGDHLLAPCLCLPADEGNVEFREAAEQVAHALRPVREEGLPHPEEEVRQLRLPRRQEKKVLVNISPLLPCVC